MPPKPRVRIYLLGAFIVILSPCVEACGAGFDLAGISQLVLEQPQSDGWAGRRMMFNNEALY